MLSTPPLSRVNSTSNNSTCNHSGNHSRPIRATYQREDPGYFMPRARSASSVSASSYTSVPQPRIKEPSSPTVRHEEKWVSPSTKRKPVTHSHFGYIGAYVSKDDDGSIGMSSPPMGSIISSANSTPAVAYLPPSNGHKLTSHKVWYSCLI